MQTRKAAQLAWPLWLLFAAPVTGQDAPFGFVGNSASVLPLSAPTETETSYLAGNSGVVRLPADYFRKEKEEPGPWDSETSSFYGRTPAWFLGGLGAMLLLGLSLTGLCLVRRTGRSAARPPRISSLI